MSNWLNPDNKFFSVMGKVFDIVVLNTIWLILCLPVVTIVPATTAMYYAVVKVIRRERSYAITEFFRSFKLNFKQGFVFSVITVVFALVLVMDFRYAWELMVAQENSGSIYLGVFFVIALLFFSMFAYLCPVLSRFDMKIGGFLKISFIMATKHLLTTIVLLLIMVGVLLGCVIMLPAVFFLPAVGTLLASFMMERVFKKYMPEKEEVDEMGEGEETEQEKKDEWYLE